MTRSRTQALLGLLLGIVATVSWAVPPVISDVEVVDVTTSSVTLVWDVDQTASMDSLRVFGDADGLVDLTSNFEVISQPLIGGDPTAVDELANLASRQALNTATKGHGLARVTVHGLTPNTTYFLRARSAVGAESSEFPAASTIVVPTASLNSFIARSQQLRLRFQHPDPTGWIVMASNPEASFAVSAVVGDGAASNEAFLNLAQMFTTVGNNYEPVGETTITLRIREGGGTIATPIFDVTFIDGFAVGLAYTLDVADPGALLQMIQPATRTYTEGETIVLAWVDDLAPSSQIALYFDTDDTGADGTQIVAGLDADLDGVDDSYSWDTVAVADGVYWVYAESPGSTSYAPAPVAIDRAGLDTDTDSMADLWEQLFFGDLANNGAGDTDFDGRIDTVEFAERTTPTEPDFRMRGVAGLNLVSWPVQPNPSLTSAEFIEQWGGLAASLERVDNTTQLVATTTWDGANAAGAVFPITAEEGYQLRLASAFDAVYAGVVATGTADLGVGVNLVGFRTVPASYSAFDLLAALGGETVVASIGHLDPATQRFVSATYSGATPIGFDFPIEPGKSYFIHLNQPVSGFAP